MSNHNNKPHLRFLQFSSQWQLKKIAEITERVILPVKVEQDKLYKQIGIRSHGKGIFHKEPVKGKSLGNKRVFWVEKNALIFNIVFAWEQAVAKTTKFESGMIASHRFPMYIPKFKEADTDFLLYFFFTNKGKSLLELASPGGAGRNKTLGQKEFENLQIFIPEIAEQKKIASVLTVIDNKIFQLKKKKILLESYKKGVVQKLFSQQLKLQDDKGKEFPMWKKKKLGELTYKAGKRNKENYILPIYSINNKEGFVPQSNQFEGMDSNKRGYDIGLYKIIESKTFAYNPARINVGSIGYSGDLNKVIISSLYVCFKTNDEVYDLFLMQYFKTSYFNKAVLQSVEGGVRAYLFYENFSNIDIALPSVKEQKKIAQFLSAIDEKINYTQTQIEQSELYKKGLLQKMFC